MGFEALQEIENLDKQLQAYFQCQFSELPSLNRAIVSFQANKTRPIYRWYKYKEAFSADLVELLFETYGINTGKILDPFAGSGTALFAASDRGIDADGIELLPIGQEIISAKQLLDTRFAPEDFTRLKEWLQLRPWKEAEIEVALPEFKISRGAYPPETKSAIARYLSACEQENESVNSVLRLALLCILESVSYTRKDGQYLRWDSRADRARGKKTFNKGEILEFDRAIISKLEEIIQDLEAAASPHKTPKIPGRIELYKGSCLKMMPSLPDCTYDAIVTSPPYCNRYDYTRTYALELALSGISERELIALRQEMLSCTVENRPKDLLEISPHWKFALKVAEFQPLLQATLAFLEDRREQKLLNNNGIPRMIRGYFYEMACIIQECHRVLKSGALFFTINDNVRYAGVSISVDLILSAFAEQLGFTVEQILVLPNPKGNSSQQMKERGRVPLRKCVYVWKKQ